MSKIAFTDQGVKKLLIGKRRHVSETVDTKQVYEHYVFTYCPESYRRWEKAKRLKPLKAPGRSGRVYYAEDEVIALFG